MKSVDERMLARVLELAPRTPLLAFPGVASIQPFQTLDRLGIDRAWKLGEALEGLGDTEGRWELGTP